MMPLRKQLMGGDPVKVSEISTDQPLPKTVHSMTAYFGAGPIVQALGTIHILREHNLGLF